MDEMNGVTPERQTQEMELQPTIPNAPSPGTVPQPVDAATNTPIPEQVDELGSELEISQRPNPSQEPGHAPPQALGSVPEQDPIHVPIVDPTLELGHPPPQALGSIPEQHPIQVTIVDPAPEPGHAPPQVLEEQLAQQPTLPQEPGQGAANRPIPLNRPLQDLFADNRRPDFFKICVPLYEASIKGNWDVAQDILQRFAQDHDQDHSYLLRCSITENKETALHVAASTQNLDFVRKLVGRMRIEDVQLQNGNGNTALCLAAMGGNVEIARAMVEHNPNQNRNENQNELAKRSCIKTLVVYCYKSLMEFFHLNQNQNQNQNPNRNRDLLTIRNDANLTPLLIAALYGKREMVTYLNDEMNRDEWMYENNRWVCLKCVEADLFDIALTIFPKLPVTENDYSETQSILGVLARKPYAFDETKKTYLNSMMGCFKERPHANTNKAMPLLTQILTATEGYRKDVLYKVLRGPPTTVRTSTDGQPPRQKNTYPSRILFVAAEMGNTKFIVELIRKYPDLIWKIDDNNRSIFHIAVSRRHESIYNLLHEIGSMKDFIVVLRDTNENNMLHLVGQMVDKNRLKDVSGAAFQMQRELLWYKEVESMLPASYQEKRNNAGETPRELFTETHKDLLIESEKWMRGTASKCMLVATLIATIVFTVAYTVPGGYNNNNGFPVFLHFAPFIVFVVLDAISLFLSIISILVFLSILTSRYAQEDFIKSLPDKLMFGLFMLFLSIMTMMIAFSVSFFVLYRHKFTIVAGSISLLALIPIITYALLHLPLMKDVFRSRFGSRYLFKPEKPMLYHRNPTL